MIKPLKIGYIPIKVIAVSEIAGDGVERKLLVVPEGITLYKNEALMIDLKNNPSYHDVINVTIPHETVSDSTKIKVGVSGNVLEDAIENLEHSMKDTEN